MDSSTIYIERDFSPSNCAKTWIFVKTSHRHISIRRALWLLALTVCKNRMHPFIPLWKTTSGGERGRRLFDLEDECSDVVAFAKNLYWCWKLEKNNSPRIHTVLTRTIAVFRYCGKCFFGIFLWFYCSFFPPFLKQTNNTNIKRRGKKRKFYY